MKIMLIIGSLQGGGAERVMHWLAQKLAGRGHSVALVTQMSKEDDVYSCTEQVHHASLGGLPRIMGSRAVSFAVNVIRWRRFLLKRADEFRPDVVMSFMDKTNVSILMAFLFRREPVIVCERSDPAAGPNISWRRYVRPWLYRNRAAEVVFQTAGVEQRYAKKWRLSRTSRVPNAVTNEFSEALVESGGRLVVSVGRLHSQKGHDLLIEAWAKLRGCRSDWKLRIIGEGPRRNEYEDLIKRLGVGDSVELPGFIPDVIGELQRASVSVLASRAEGFPNALIEMMAIGRAVVASDLPEVCTEVVDHNVNGLLFHGSSSSALASAIGSLIGNESLRDRLGKNALSVRARYSEERCLDLWEECIERNVLCD